MGALPWPPMYELSSGLPAPADETGTPQPPAVSDPGLTSAGVPSPADSPAALCPNCIVELDADRFCSLCGRMETGAWSDEVFGMCGCGTAAVGPQELCGACFLAEYEPEQSA